MKYVFRGNIVFIFDEDTNELLTQMIGDFPAINYCKFIDEDFILMEQFFTDINKFKRGEITELKDIVVN